MERKDYIKLFTDAIKQSEKALVFDIDIDYDSFDGDEIYIDFSYQIDDRIADRCGRTDEEVIASIKKIIGDSYGVSIYRQDAFPNGYAAYKATFDN
jgi:hypothetical protein